MVLTGHEEIEKAIGVQPLETISIHPNRPLYEACRAMLDSKARRIPLIDVDDETKRPMVVSVVTQYRILKFVAVNVSETQLLRKPLKNLKLGSYRHLETARMETPVFDVIHQLVNNSISSVPIVNSDGVVTNVFEAVDVITLIKGGMYDELNLNVGEALQKRSEVCLSPLPCRGGNSRIDECRISRAFSPAQSTTVSIQFSTRSENLECIGLLSLTKTID